MKPIRGVLLFALACTLASCDAVFEASGFEAEASGAVNASFGGTGEARILADVVSTTYSLLLRDDDRLTVVLSRGLLTAPEAGVFPIGASFAGDSPETFGSDVVLRGEGAPAAPRVLENATGTLTVERCTRSDLRGRFVLRGTLNGEPLALDGSFDIPRVRGDRTPDPSLALCA